MKESGIVGVMGLTIQGGKGLTTEPVQGKISTRLFNDIVQNRLTSFAFDAVRSLAASTGMCDKKTVRITEVEQILLTL